jgi:hypothetical protein
MLCAPGHVFDGTVGVGSCFHVLRSRTHFRRYRGLQISFPCFVLQDSFSAVTWASTPVFMFCAPELIFGGSEGVGSSLHVLRSLTRFWRYRRRRVPLSCFALPDTFPAVQRSSCPVVIFCARGLIFDGSKGVGSRLHVLRPRTHFRR